MYWCKLRDTQKNYIALFRVIQCCRKVLHTKNFIKEPDNDGNRV